MLTSERTFSSSTDRNSKLFAAQQLIDATDKVVHGGF